MRPIPVNYSYFPLVFVLLFASYSVRGQSVDEVKGVKIKDISSLKDNVKDPNWVDVPVRDENGVIRPSGLRRVQPTPGNYEPFQLDAAVQKVSLGEVTTESKNTSPAINVPIVGTNINGLPYQFLNPADPTVAVGPNHIIQMVNGTSGALFQIWDKSTGAVLIPSRYLDQITTKGGLGDPIVLYDQMANRFIMTEFVNSIEAGQEGLSMAVSATADPAGAWYIYFFGTGTTFPDYPKFSVWHNAYYASSNNFDFNAYSGSTIYAFDRLKMLAGDPLASVQKFTFATTSFSRYYTMSPVNQQGTASSTSGGLFAYMHEDAWTADVNDRDSIGLIEFNPNFGNPLLSTYGTVQSLAVATTNSTICTAVRGACIPMPGTVTRLEGLENRIMNQPMYRNFGGSEGVVMVTTVNNGNGIASPRWYEVTRSNGGNWTIRQQSTYTSGTIHRWMGSIAYTAAGDIALAYNTSDGTSVYPSLRFTGRTQCDPLNTMTMPETVIAAGINFNGSSRYGDYNHLVTDPDGNRFWFTGMFNDQTRWNTKVASFTIDNCSTPPPTCVAPTGLAVSTTTNTSATVSWASSVNSIGYVVEYKPATSTTWLTATANTTLLTWTITGLQGSTAYNWRVSSLCGSSRFTSTESTFNTMGITSTCGAPTGLVVSTAGATSATVTWSALNGAASYRVEYKLPNAVNWTLVAASNTSRSQSISGLTAFTTYDWRVAATCNGTLGEYAISQLKTGDSYENNQTAGTSKTIPVNTNILGAISTATDLDWYRFTIARRATQKNLRIVLQNMPAAYDIALFNTTSATTPLGTTVTSGTGAGRTVTITYNVDNTRDVTYYVRVSGSASQFNNMQTYTLNALTSAAPFTAIAPVGPIVDDPSNPNPGMALNPEITRLYPVPAKNQLIIEYLALAKGKCTIIIFDHLGNKKMAVSRSVDSGNNTISLNVTAIPAGQYIVQIIQEGHLSNKRFEIRK